MKKSITHLAVAMALAVTVPLASAAYAGPAGDALSQCLIQKTTKDDRATLARWIFAVMSKHPGVADMVNTDDAKYVEINKAGGGLFTRLMAKDCAAQSAEAIRTEGSDGFGNAFKGLGEMAMIELMGDPTVQGSMSDLVKYVDSEAIMQAMLSNPAPK